MINVLWALMEKADNTQKQIGNKNREMGTPIKRRKCQKKKYYTINEYHFINDKVVSRLDTARERINVGSVIRQQKLPNLKGKEKKE